MSTYKHTFTFTFVPERGELGALGISRIREASGEHIGGTITDIMAGKEVKITLKSDTWVHAVALAHGTFARLLPASTSQYKVSHVSSDMR